MMRSLSVLLAAAATAAPAVAVPTDFKAQADAILARSYPGDGPGAIAVVYEKGRPVYAAARGLADVETRRPLDPSMPVRLGSITKQFTAATIMKLVEEGKIGLDDPLSKYVPDFPKPGGDATVRQLLTHTSGIQSYTAIPLFMVTHARQPHTTGQLIARFRDAPAVYPNGARYQYNNSGYVLLGAIIEKVTGKPWHQAVEERVTRPLKLDSIRYGGSPGAEQGLPRAYTRDAMGKPAPAMPIDMSVPHAAGALLGTAADLAEWGRALHQGKVVKPASYQQMIARTPLPAGASEAYGFGLSLGTVRGRAIIGHDGGIPGFQTDGIYLPGEDLYVAVFANSDRSATDPELVSRRLAAAAIGEPFETFSAIPLNPKAIEPLTGVYKAGDIERTLYLRDGKLFTRRKGSGPLEVTPAAGDRFFYEGSNSWFAIERGADGKLALLWHGEGARDAERMQRAGPVPAEAPIVSLSREQLQPLAGKYRGPAPVVVAIDSAGVLTLKFGDQPLTHLDAESPTMFRVREIEAKVSFQMTGGKVSGLTIHQGGRDLPIPRAD